MSPDVVELRVLIDGLGLVRPAVAAHVGRDGVVTRGGEGGELMAPRIPGLGEAVAEQDERARALLGHVHADAVRVEGAVSDLAHRRPSRYLSLASLPPTPQLDFSTS